MPATISRWCRSLARTVATVAAVGAALLLTVTAGAQESQPEQSADLDAHLLRPEQLDFNESLLGRLQLPPGFRVNVFAGGMGQPRILVAREEGTVFITRRGTDDVVAIKDDDGDGKADRSWKVVPYLKLVHGLAFRGDTMYLASDNKLFTAALQADGMAGKPEELVGDLPDAGQHPNRTLAFGPDGMLYVSVGSTCNACDDANEENATLLKMAPDGSARTIVARGLRNTIGWGWHPDTGQLWGMDHGSDWRGNDQPPEELNRLEQGKHYGWPFCFAARQVDLYLTAEPKGSEKGDFCTATTAPVLTYQAHSAPMQLMYYTGGQFPPEYRGDAFVTMRGSWNRAPASGYKVVRVRFQDGQPTAIDDFMTGFLTDGGRAHFGRLVGLAQLPDGSMLVGDDTNGVIYRVSFGAP